jgi:SpoVK/Ycf46/Vps4 family AAA+-type ATPase
MIKLNKKSKLVAKKFFSIKFLNKIQIQKISRVNCFINNNIVSFVNSSIHRNSALRKGRGGSYSPHEVSFSYRDKSPFPTGKGMEKEFSSRIQSNPYWDKRTINACCGTKNCWNKKNQVFNFISAKNIENPYPFRKKIIIWNEQNLTKKSSIRLKKMNLKKDFKYQNLLPKQYNYLLRFSEVLQKKINLVYDKPNICLNQDNDLNKQVELKQTDSNFSLKTKINLKQKVNNSVLYKLKHNIKFDFENKKINNDYFEEIKNIKKCKEIVSLENIKMIKNKKKAKNTLTRLILNRLNKTPIGSTALFFKKNVLTNRLKKIKNFNNLKFNFEKPSSPYANLFYAFSSSCFFKENPLSLVLVQKKRNAWGSMAAPFPYGHHRGVSSQLILSSISENNELFLNKKTNEQSKKKQAEKTKFFFLTNLFEQQINQNMDKNYEVGYNNPFSRFNKIKHKNNLEITHKISFDIINKKKSSQVFPDFLSGSFFSPSILNAPHFPVGVRGDFVLTTPSPLGILTLPRVRAHSEKNKQEPMTDKRSFFQSPIDFSSPQRIPLSLSFGNSKRSIDTRQHSFFPIAYPYGNGYGKGNGTGLLPQKGKGSGSRFLKDRYLYKETQENKKIPGFFFYWLIPFAGFMISKSNFNWDLKPSLFIFNSCLNLVQTPPKQIQTLYQIPLSIQDFKNKPFITNSNIKTKISNLLKQKTLDITKLDSFSNKKTKNFKFTSVLVTKQKTKCLNQFELTYFLFNNLRTMTINKKIQKLTLNNYKFSTRLNSLNTNMPLYVQPFYPNIHVLSPLTRVKIPIGKNTYKPEQNAFLNHPKIAFHSANFFLENFIKDRNNKIQPTLNLVVPVSLPSRGFYPFPVGDEIGNSSLGMGNGRTSSHLNSKKRYEIKTKNKNPIQMYFDDPIFFFNNKIYETKKKKVSDLAITPVGVRTPSIDPLGKSLSPLGATAPINVRTLKRVTTPSRRFYRVSVRKGVGHPSPVFRSFTQVGPKSLLTLFSPLLPSPLGKKERVEGVMPKISDRNYLQNSQTLKNTTKHLLADDLLAKTSGQNGSNLLINLKTLKISKPKLKIKFLSIKTKFKQPKINNLFKILKARLEQISYFNFLNKTNKHIFINKVIKDKISSNQLVLKIDHPLIYSMSLSPDYFIKEKIKSYKNSQKFFNKKISFLNSTFIFKKQNTLNTFLKKNKKKIRILNKISYAGSMATRVRVLTPSMVSVRKGGGHRAPSLRNEGTTGAAAPSEGSYPTKIKNRPEGGGTGSFSERTRKNPPRGGINRNSVFLKNYNFEVRESIQNQQNFGKEVSNFTLKRFIDPLFPEGKRDGSGRKEAFRNPIDEGSKHKGKALLNPKSDLESTGYGRAVPSLGQLNSFFGKYVHFLIENLINAPSVPFLSSATEKGCYSNRGKSFNEAVFMPSPWKKPSSVGLQTKKNENMIRQKMYSLSKYRRSLAPFGVTAPAIPSWEKLTTSFPEGNRGAISVIRGFSSSRRESTPSNPYKGNNPFISLYESKNNLIKKKASLSTTPFLEKLIRTFFSHGILQKQKKKTALTNNIINFFPRSVIKAKQKATNKSQKRLLIFQNNSSFFNKNLLRPFRYETNKTLKKHKLNIQKKIESFRLFFKNKKFFKKTAWVKDKQTQYEEKFILKKNKQKKHRVKKRRKLNLSRKKRKRFYPRPVWLRYRTYLRWLITKNFNSTKSNDPASVIINNQIFDHFLKLNLPLNDSHLIKEPLLEFNGVRKLYTLPLSGFLPLPQKGHVLRTYLTDPAGGSLPLLGFLPQEQNSNYNDSRIPSFETFNYKISNAIKKGLFDKSSGSSVKRKNLQNYFKRIKDYFTQIRTSVTLVPSHLRGRERASEKKIKIEKNQSQYYKNRIKEIQNKEEYNRIIYARIQKIIQISSVLDASKDWNERSNIQRVEKNLDKFLGVPGGKVLEEIEFNKPYSKKSEYSKNVFLIQKDLQSQSKIKVHKQGHKKISLFSVRYTKLSSKDPANNQNGPKRLKDLKTKTFLQSTWMWLYNIGYGNFCWSSITGFNSFELPNQTKPIPISWALKKTNNWFSGKLATKAKIEYKNNNQNINLWSLQKLKNQSKSNKTKYLQKKISNYLEGVLVGEQKFKNFVLDSSFSQKSNKRIAKTIKLASEVLIKKQKNYILPIFEVRGGFTLPILYSAKHDFFPIQSLPVHKMEKEGPSHPERLSSIEGSIPLQGKSPFDGVRKVMRRGYSRPEWESTFLADLSKPYQGNSPNRENLKKEKLNKFIRDKQNKYINFFIQTKTNDLHKKILQKWKKKEQKIQYLGEQTLNFHPFKKRKKIHFLLKNQILNKNLVKPQKNVVRSNNWWFNDFNLINRVLSTKQKFNFFPTFEIKSFKDFYYKKEIFTNIGLPEATNYIGSIFYSFVFHFCTLLSLISLFQIRSYIKFHLLILFKISKNSNYLIKSIFNSIKNFISIKIDQISKMFLQKKKLQQTSYGSSHTLILQKKLKSLFHDPLEQTTLFSSYKTDERINYLNKKRIKILQDRNIIQYHYKIIKLFLQTNTQKKSRKLLFQQLQKTNFVGFRTHKNSKIFFQKIFNKILYSSCAKMIPSEFLYNLNKKSTQLKKNKAFPYQGNSPSTDPLGKSLSPFGARALREWEGSDKEKPPRTLIKATAPIGKDVASETFIGQKLLKKALITKLFFLSISGLNTKNKLLFLNSLIKLKNTFSFNFKNLNKSKIFIILKNQLLIPEHFFNSLTNYFRNFLKTIVSIFKNPESVFNDFIGNAFLLEWTLDFQKLIPENIEIFMWNKFSIESNHIKRNLRINLLFITLSFGIRSESLIYFDSVYQGQVLMSPFLPHKGFLEFLPFPGREQQGLLLQQGQQPFGVTSTNWRLPFETAKPGNEGRVGIENIVLLSFIIGFLQRTIAPLIYSFVQILSEPDTDLILRQKKGTIFWDNWSEILTKAAEEYNIIIPSLTLLKDEQTKFIQKLMDSSNLKTLSKGIYSRKQVIFPFPSEKIQSIFPGKDKNFFIVQSLSRRSLTLSRARAPVVPSFRKERQTVRTLIKVAKQSSLEPLTKRAKSGDFKFKGINFVEKVKSSQIAFIYPFGTCWLRSSIELLREHKKELKKPFYLGSFQSKNKFNYKNKQIFQQNIFPGFLLLNGFSESWPVNQFTTNQSKDTDLFIDLHPPKSFSHIGAIKYYRQIQQPLGNLICSIYSGIFIKQPAKNILIVGQSAFEKSLLITALAGETELKVITDNATRYSLVVSGVAVGLRLLKDVFEALVFHTPCLFLLENIHVIGEKRPLIFSDSAYNVEEGILGDDSFGLQKVEEQNKISAENSNHIIKHYRKPYKGEFSSAIPTNHFNFDLFASDAMFSTKVKHSLSLFIGQNNIKSQSQKNPIKIKNIDVLTQVKSHSQTFGIPNDSPTNNPSLSNTPIGATAHSISQSMNSFLSSSKKGFGRRIFQQPQKRSAFASSHPVHSSTNIPVGKGSKIIISKKGFDGQPLPILKEEGTFLTDPSRGFLPQQGQEKQYRSSFYKEDSTGTILEYTNNISEIGLSFKNLLKKSIFQNSTRLNRLNIKPDPLLIPPATSPLHVFAIKEQKKFQQKKIVKELPFEGLSSEQSNLVPRYTYSIRTKIALLAEKALLNMSVKLDMITDLLIILDSVRANRGFVVFATTHIPSILDPALRRPGRLDETIRIPKVQNIWSRWQIFKTTLDHIFKPLKYNTSIFKNPSITVNNYSSAKSYLVSKTNISTIDFIGTNSTTKNFINLMKNGITIFNKQIIFQSSSFYKSNLLNSTLLKQVLLENQKITNQGDSRKPKQNLLDNLSVSSKRLATQALLPQQNGKVFWDKDEVLQSKKLILPINKEAMVERARQSSKGKGKDKYLKNVISVSKQYKKSIDNKPIVTDLLHKKLLKSYKVKALTYFDVGKKLINTKISYNISSSEQQGILDKTFSGDSNFNETFNLLAEIQIATLYSNKTLLKSFLTKLFAGKICESFAFSNVQKFKNTFLKTNNLFNNSLSLSTDIVGENSQSSSWGDCPKEGSIATLIKRPEWECQRGGSDPVKGKSPLKNSLKTILNPKHLFSGIRGFQTLYGLDDTWTASTSLIFSFIQKRYMFNKNLIVPSLLTFKGPGAYSESPPDSFVLLPGKRYENYKRALGTFEKKSEITIGEKIQIHQQKRFIMRLYKIQVPELFRSEAIPVTKVFSNKEISQNSLEKDISSNLFSLGEAGRSKTDFKGIVQSSGLNNKVPFSNIFLTLNPIQKVCHKISATNLLYRHKILDRHRQYLTNQWWSQQLAEYNSEAIFLSDVDWRYTFIDSLGEFLIDYPDTDQISKGQNTLGFENSWFNLNQIKNIEIFEHFIFESFIKGFNWLDKNREFLDYSAYIYQKKGFLKENHLINIFQRFSD